MQIIDKNFCQETAPDAIIKLVKRFENCDKYELNEAEVRLRYVEVFFKELGWDVNNEKGQDEVKPENEIEGQKADYGFYINRQLQFFIEVKKSDINLNRGRIADESAFQVKTYGWKASLKISILTNFNQLIIYNCYDEPKDSAKEGLIRKFTSEQYISNWEEICRLLSRESVERGSLEKYYENYLVIRKVREVYSSDHGLKLELERLTNIGWLNMEKLAYEKAAESYQTAANTVQEQEGSSEIMANFLSKAGESFCCADCCPDLYTKAKISFERALDIYKKTSKTKKDIVETLRNLGTLHEKYGQYESAKICFEEILIVYKEISETTDEDIFFCLWNLAILYEKCGQYESAKTFFEKALKLCKEVLPANHIYIKQISVDFASCLNNLAESNNYEDVKSLYKQALDILGQIDYEVQENYGIPSLTANICNNLAEQYDDEDNYESASKFYKRALDINDLHGENSLIAENLYNLATSYVNQYRDEEAEPLFERALGISENELGVDISKSLDELHKRQKYSEESEIMYEEIEELYQEWGYEKKEQEFKLWEYDDGEAQQLDQWQYKEVEQRYEKVLALFSKVYGEIHPRIEKISRELAHLYREQGQYERAEHLLEKVLKIRKISKGSYHDYDVARSLDELAFLYYSQGNYEPALSLLKQVLFIFQQYLDVHRTETIVYDKQTVLENYNYSNQGLK